MSDNFIEYEGPDPVKCGHCEAPAVSETNGGEFTHFECGTELHTSGSESRTDQCRSREATKAAQRIDDATLSDWCVPANQGMDPWQEPNVALVDDARTVATVFIAEHVNDGDELTVEILLASDWKPWTTPNKWENETEDCYIARSDGEWQLRSFDPDNVITVMETVQDLRSVHQLFAIPAQVIVPRPG